MSVFKYRISPQDEWITLPVIKGETPIKGVDYFTDEEIQEILEDYYTKSEVDKKISSGGTIDLSGYALKTELPVVPENVSSFTNDSGYQTAAQVNALITAALGEIASAEGGNY